MTLSWPTVGTRQCLSSSVESVAQNAHSHGHRVQVNVLFKGREMAHIDLGRELLMKFVAALEDIAKMEAPPRLEGRRMGVLLIPKP